MHVYNGYFKHSLNLRQFKDVVPLRQQLILIPFRTGGHLTV